MSRVEEAVLTIVIPVKNEEKNLGRCLSSLTLNYKVIVADSGSTDRTVEIAHSFGAEVVQFKWQGGFPKKRNWVLQNFEFETKWILFLDADEQLTPEFEKNLPAALSRNDIAGYWIKYTNHFLGKALRHGIPQRKLALFRIGSGFYERIEDPMWSAMDMEVHEHPILEGKVDEYSGNILHRDFKNMHQYIGKHNEYSTWEVKRIFALDLSEGKTKLTARQKIKYKFIKSPIFPVFYFFLDYVLYFGLADGWVGFVKSAMKMIYFFEIYVKIAELKQNEEASDV